MLNLRIGVNSILEEVENYNFTAQKEGNTGICIEVNNKGSEVVLDDSDWSEFMNENRAEFLSNNEKAYYYKMGDKLLLIPIDSVSDDESDVYLDVNNIEVCLESDLAIVSKLKNLGEYNIKLYCNLKLEGIETVMDFNKNFTGLNTIVNLDDIHFTVPNPKDVDGDDINVHLDFNEIDVHFVDGEVLLRLKGLADTWNDLNLEEGLSKDDITIDLLKKGTLENYVMSFNKDNGEIFTDITVTKIGCLDEENNEIYFKIDKYAVNEA